MKELFMAFYLSIKNMDSSFLIKKVYENKIQENRSNHEACTYMLSSSHAHIIKNLSEYIYDHISSMFKMIKQEVN